MEEGEGGRSDGCADIRLDGGVDLVVDPGDTTHVGRTQACDVTHEEGHLALVEADGGAAREDEVLGLALEDVCQWQKAERRRGTGAKTRAG